MWVGTDDTADNGWWSPTNTTGTNLVNVTLYEYDGGGVGDGNLTKVTQLPDGILDSLGASTAADRVTEVAYDWRNRLVASKTGATTSAGTEAEDVQRQADYRVLDNLGQQTAFYGYDGDTVDITTDANSDGVPDLPASSRMHTKVETAYDAQGRVFRSTEWNIAGGHSLRTNYWYDGRGNLIKTSAPGGLVTKYTYDGAGRVIKTYQSDGSNTTGLDANYTDATTVTGDAVLTQTETQYDKNGNVILTIKKDRYHDAAAGARGELGDINSDNVNQARARLSYVAYHYDDADRLTDIVDVGTNYDPAAGDFSLYENLTTVVPARSDRALVTSYAYDDAGRIESVTDPRGIVMRTEYDALGRTTKTIEAYEDGIPESAESDRDRVTAYTYDGSDHVLTMTADLPGTSDDQTTTYTYGVNVAGGSSINSNDLLASITYPDTARNDTEIYAYNALGQRTRLTDRNTTVHEYGYDALGRPVSDAATTLASGVDGSRRRLQTSYNAQGLPEKFTSYDVATGGTSSNIVNEVLRQYNGYGQVTFEYQQHGGPVDTATTPKVQYLYNSAGGNPNYSRLIGMFYPNGRNVTFQYNSGIDSRISQVSGLGGAETYKYLGLDTVVRRAQQNGVELAYYRFAGETNVGDAGDQYTGLDRFGRVVDQRWRKTSDGTATDRFAYGYDADGNRLYKQNLLDTTKSELYHGGSGYDMLNRLSSFARGTLNTAKNAMTTGAGTRSQSWNLDALGNWSSVTTDVDGDGSAAATTESRTHNAQNQIDTLSGLSESYDANGNFKGSPENTEGYTYDAWNRLISFARGMDSRAEYKYDALGRRILSHTSDPAEHTVDLYYSVQWQVLEEREGATVKAQYLWSPIYVDALIRRDRDADGSSANGMEERLYVQQDANFNVTSVTNSSGVVQERYIYDPYGSATVLDADWANDADGQSDFDWKYLHQGGRYDATSRLYSFRHRDYSPTLGRWLQQDSAGYVDGGTLFAYALSRPTGVLDPSGLSGVEGTDGAEGGDRTAQEIKKKIWELYNEGRKAEERGDDKAHEAITEQVRRLEEELRDRNPEDPPEHSNNKTTCEKMRADAKAALEAAVAWVAKTADDAADLADDAAKLAQDSAEKGTAIGLAVLVLIGAVVAGSY